MSLEQQLNELTGLLEAHIDRSTLDEFRDFVDAGEYGVGLEFVCDRLSDDEEQLVQSEADLIHDLARQMGLTRPSIDDIDDLVVPSLR